MSKLHQIIYLVVASITVGIADSLLKKVSQGGSFAGAIKNPWFFVSLVLYLCQILIFVYLFVKKWELGVVGIIQNILYAIVVVAVGWLFFKEKLSGLQITGAVLALIGIALIQS